MGREKRLRLRERRSERGPESSELEPPIEALLVVDLNADVAIFVWNYRVAVE